MEIIKVFLATSNTGGNENNLFISSFAKYICGTLQALEQ